MLVHPQKNIPQVFWGSISRSLAVSNPQVLEILDFKLSPLKWINSWAEPAVSCGLRELRVELPYISTQLPIRLYTCGTLKTLTLHRLHLVDVQRLLSICPVLEDLVVRRYTYVSVKIFTITINVPTFRSLSIDYSLAISQPAGVHGFVINAPSLRYLNIIDHFSNFLQFENMPELVKANVEIVCDQPESLLANADHLKMAKFSSKSTEKHHMFKKL